MSNSLYNVVSIADDELFLSWLNRMANVNSFKNVSDFYYKFLIHNTVPVKKHINALVEFVNGFNYKNGDLSSPISIFMKHYNYSVKLQFHSNLFIWNTIKNVTESSNIKFLHSSIVNDKKEVYCPHCQKEDLHKHNYIYPHVEHAVPLNKICYYHKVPLIYKEYGTNIYQTYEIVGLETIYLAYAEAIHALYQLNYIIDYETFYTCIHNKIKTSYSDDDSLNDYLMFLYKNSIFVNLPIDDSLLIKNLNDSIYNYNLVLFEFKIIVILLLYGSMESFLKEITLPNYSSSVKVILDSNSDFNLLEDSFGLLRIKHSCSYEFVTTSYMVTHDLTCFKCVSDRCDNNKSFQDFVGSIAGEDFIPNKYPLNTSSNIDMYHKKCNKIFPTNIYKFYNKQTCNICEKEERLITPTTNFAQTVTDLVGNEYTIISKYFNMYSKIEMLHNKCGNSIFVKPNSFAKGRRCKCCRIIKAKLVEFVFNKSDGLYEIIVILPGYASAKIRNTKTGEVKILPKMLIEQEINRPTPSQILPL